MQIIEFSTILENKLYFVSISANIQLLYKSNSATF